jgi:hypothetical protein
MHKTKLVLLDDWPLTTQDDLIVAGVSGAAARLAKGTDGQVLTVDPTTHHLVWSTPAGMSNPMTTAADLIVGGTAGAATRLAKGSDGQVLTVDPTTHLLVWATPSAGSSGASTADRFVTTAVDADLSANTVIPGLSGSPDVRAGGGNDWEFDSSSTTGWSSFAGGGAVTFDFNTTAKSHAYVKVATNGSADKFGGIIHAAPSVPFTVTAKLSDCNFLATTVWPVLFVSDSSTAAGNSVYVGLYGGTPRDGANTNMQTFTGFGSSGAVGQTNKAAIYLRLVVHAANNIDTLVSYNGFVWYTVRTALNVCATAGYFGIAIDAFGAACETVWDWVRF